MPRPRNQCVSLDATPYYHCVSRCVRRAFLFGVDHNTGQSFEHRCEWIEQRIIELSNVFTIDICAYAVMHNHYHLVLHIDAARAEKLTDTEVLMRWSQLFAGPQLLRDYLRNPQAMNEAQQLIIHEMAAGYRARLCDLSWFMRCLNEPIARQANAEDNCSGHFWESRFKSQALLDEAALLSAMAYVDLNPVRANIANTPEASEFTSVYARLHSPSINAQLLAFYNSTIKQQAIASIPFSWLDYLQLVDWTGRAIRADKRGAIACDAPPILARLSMNAQQWLTQHHQLETHYPNFLGQWKSLQAACHIFKRKWIQGRKYSQLLFDG